MIMDIAKAVLDFLTPATNTKIHFFPAVGYEAVLAIPRQRNRVGFIIEYVTSAVSVPYCKIICTNEQGSEASNKHTVRLLNDGDSYTSDPSARDYTGDVWLKFEVPDANSGVCVTVFERENWFSRTFGGR